MEKVVIACTNARRLGEKIAEELSCPKVEFEKEIFPDGEFKIRLKGNVKDAEVIIVQSGYPGPNESMFEVFFVINVARYLGAKKITLVLPYLPYARQDIRFIKPGKEEHTESLSSEVIATLIKAFDVSRLVTVDMHSKRICPVVEGSYDFFGVRAYNVSASDIIAEYVKKMRAQLLLVATDEGAMKRVQFASEKTGLDYVVLKKKRISATVVQFLNIEEVREKVTGKDVLLLDDIISTGGTMITAANELRNLGAGDVFFGATHGTFNEMTLNSLEQSLAGINRLGAEKALVIADTIQTKATKISVAKKIAALLR